MSLGANGGASQASAATVRNLLSGHGDRFLTRNLRRLRGHVATEAILADEERRHGGLPPRIAAMRSRPAATS